MQAPAQCLGLGASVAALGARLMSLDAHELRRLAADRELLRRLAEAQALVESRLGPDEPQRLAAAAHQLRLLLQLQAQRAHCQLQPALDLRTAPSGPRAEPPKRLRLGRCRKLQQPQSAPVSAARRATAAAQSAGGAPPTTSAKRHKGEFDEPTPAEVAHRQLGLHRPAHYHRLAAERGQCACVLGSQFRDKSSGDVLLMIERWRASDVELRTQWKWDVSDLPKDIPLGDIKKFEDLRRQFSDGRADFGGASKRRPLGIRATRQFLLILYCLWGHPGREDPMQRDGYCPHCFAKIRQPNEQSTLVRVVNHFNMKHRRGANPRPSAQVSACNSATASAAACLLSLASSGPEQPRPGNVNCENSPQAARSAP